MDADYSPRCRLVALLLIAAAAILRMLYLAWDCPLDLAPDEAQYWDWSRQLDWSYLSKGPLIAWLIRASCACFGETMLAVRLPAVLCGSLLIAGLYTLTVQVYRSDRLALALTALAMTLPIVAAGAALMTTDAPFMCSWIWALAFAHRALFRPTWWAWPSAGLCVLVGVLAKHTMVLFVPSLGFFLLTAPALRSLVARPGVWIMTALGALGGVPILAWNAANDWVTLKHTGIHAGLEDKVSLRWLGPLAYVGTQFAVLFGVWFVVWVRAVWEHRPTREPRLELQFLWWMSAPTFVFFGLFSLLNGGGEANWPLAGYLAGMVLAAGWMRDQWRDSEGWRRRAAALSVAGGAVLGLLLTLAIHAPIQVQPVLLSIAGTAGSADPAPICRIDLTVRLRGWRHLAAEVDQVRADLEARGVEPVLAAERWTQAGEMGFYCAGQPRFHCLGLYLGDRATQYDLWRPNPVADPEEFHGRTFLIVGRDLERLDLAFDALARSRTVEYRENGELVAAWTIAIGHGYRGTPNCNKRRGMVESSFPSQWPKE
jgi:4-amino-4-deoxy-L-arabinose transferase-like glycosyltransferase